MSALKDKNGLTESEFLQRYDPTAYDRPSVTVDMLVFCEDKLLLIKRGNHPFLGCYALPGGFVNMDESCESAALRELKEETDTTAPLKQLCTVSTPNRDPRGRIITVCYVAEVPDILSVKGGDDADSARWFTVTRRASGDLVDLSLTADNGEECGATLRIKRSDGAFDFNRTSIEDNRNLAGDHSKIIAYAMEKRQ